MSARGFWIVALGAALAFLIALNVFRSEEPGSAGADIARDPPSEAVPAQRPVEAARGSPSEQRADAPSAPSPDALPPQQPAAAPRPTPGPYASMSAALADLDAPPERRMPLLPETVETDRAFAAESVDPVWSAATEAGVLSRIAEIPDAAYVSLNVECRTTLCLLQFVQAATPAPSSGIAEIAELVEPQGLKSLWMFGIRVRGGAPLGIAYLQRADAAETSATAPQPSAQETHAPRRESHPRLRLKSSPLDWHARCNVSVQVSRSQV